MIPGSAPHIWENNLESDKRRDTALLLELLCLCAKKKEPLAALLLCVQNVIKLRRFLHAIPVEETACRWYNESRMNTGVLICAI